MDKPSKDQQHDVRVIYSGGYVRDLGIVTEGGMQGWLVYRHPDGQWVTLADLPQHLELLVDRGANRLNALAEGEKGEESED